MAGEQQADWPCGSFPLNTVVAETLPQAEDPGDARIVVKREVQVTLGDPDPHAI